MPLEKFICPDGETIWVDACLKWRGCRMWPNLPDRCAPLPVLKKISFDRKFSGVSPSMAGNGPRYQGLKATVGYAVRPSSRAFSLHGTTFHGRMAEEGITYNVLSEEPMSDEQAKGTPDLLEMDEHADSGYILTDYKTSGSYKLAKWLGIYIKKTNVPILGTDGTPVILKSGKNKGKPKTRVHKEIIQDPNRVDKIDLNLQVNRYRIFFEQNNFPINKMRAFVVPRDGNSYLAESRGILGEFHFVPVDRLENKEVLDYYKRLTGEIGIFFATGYIRPCNAWENWEGRRCVHYCEVNGYCRDMCLAHKEKWPGDNKVPEEGG